jgi:hypothetical protein
MTQRERERVWLGELRTPVASLWPRLVGQASPWQNLPHVTANSAPASGQRPVSLVPLANASNEFRQLVPYQPSHDWRRIDWPAYARSRSAWVRQFEPLANQRSVVLWWFGSAWFRGSVASPLPVANAYAALLRWQHAQWAQGALQPWAWACYQPHLPPQGAGWSFHQPSPQALATPPRTLEPTRLQVLAWVEQATHLSPTLPLLQGLTPESSPQQALNQLANSAQGLGGPPIWMIVGLPPQTQWEQCLAPHERVWLQRLAHHGQLMLAPFSIPTTRERYRA